MHVVNGLALSRNGSLFTFNGAGFGGTMMYGCYTAITSRRPFGNTFGDFQSVGQSLDTRFKQAVNFDDRKKHPFFFLTSVTFIIIYLRDKINHEEIRYINYVHQ